MDVGGDVDKPEAISKEKRINVLKSRISNHECCHLAEIAGNFEPQN